MNEKPAHLPMDFDEALKRLARVPKSKVKAIKPSKSSKIEKKPEKKSLARSKR